MSGTRSQSPPLHFPDSSDEERNKTPKLDSDDSVDEFFAKPVLEMVDSVVSGTNSKCL
jgi:hypothetical protein